VREESRAFYEATVLVGRISVPVGWTGPVIVAAVRIEQDRRLVEHQVRLHEPGGYELIVGDGDYTVIAYADADGNGRPDSRDLAGRYKDVVQVEDARLVSLLDFDLTTSGASALRDDLPLALPDVSRHSTQVGALADLDAPEFSAASGREGYWTPMEAFRRIGGNVYFIEPFDPSRIPVLFVHGAAGSAQDWRYFIEHLDRSRYQAWVFQYPSGGALDSMSHLLYWKLLNLKMRYGFTRLHVVAHSMGGLVARRFLLDHGDQFPEIGHFVSVSMPWGGEPSAALGVKHSPGVVPSWRDMQPAGAFLGELFARDLPAHVSHTLLFGHRGGYNRSHYGRRASRAFPTNRALERPAKREARLPRVRVVVLVIELQLQVIEHARAHRCTERQLIALDLLVDDVEVRFGVEACVPGLDLHVDAARRIQQQVAAEQARHLVAHRFTAADGRIAIHDLGAAHVGIAELERPAVEEPIFDAKLEAGIVRVDDAPCRARIVRREPRLVRAETDGPAPVREAFARHASRIAGVCRRHRHELQHTDDDRACGNQGTPARRL
jgi:pimeloyl-ACP methyl ester carboxylesterase